MGRDSKKRRERPRESEFKKFLKKRAPIYLAVAALVVVFVVPEITKKNLQSHFPEDLAVEERMVLDALMGYSGGDGTGLSVMGAVSDKISEEYGEDIYNDSRTTVDIRVSESGPDTHRVALTFESHKGMMSYSWQVDANTNEIRGEDPRSKHIVNLVDFYD